MQRSAVQLRVRLLNMTFASLRLPAGVCRTSKCRAGGRRRRNRAAHPVRPKLYRKSWTPRSYVSPESGSVMLHALSYCLLLLLAGQQRSWSSSCCSAGVNALKAAREEANSVSPPLPAAAAASGPEYGAKALPNELSSFLTKVRGVSIQQQLTGTCLSWRHHDIPHHQRSQSWHHLKQSTQSPLGLLSSRESGP